MWIKPHCKLLFFLQPAHNLSRDLFLLESVCASSDKSPLVYLVALPLQRFLSTSLFHQGGLEALRGPAHGAS